MIVEQRTYTLYPGKVPDFLNYVETMGLPVLEPTLGGLLGYFTAESGNLHQVIHFWAYESMAERERRRAEIAEKPAYQDFVRKVLPLMVTMESRILKPASFTKLALKPQGDAG